MKTNLLKQAKQSDIDEITNEAAEHLEESYRDETLPQQDYVFNH